jgi:putative membrane protein
MSESFSETSAKPSESPAGSRPADQPTDDRATIGERAGRWLASRGRLERELQQAGTDPDARFTFANERTFLAWNRTALALIAAGLAAAQFLHFDHHWLRLVIAVPLIVLGAVLAFASYLHWGDNELALRLRRSLRYSWMPRLLTGGILFIALCGGIVAIIDRLVH